MTRNILLLLFAFAFLASPTLAQTKATSSKSAKARKAKVTAVATARSKAEAARRAEAVRIAANNPLAEGPDAAELLRIDAALSEATVRSNAEVITHLLADEYIAVNAKGLVTNKRDWLNAIANDEGHCEVNKGFEFVVRVYGSTGLVVHNTSFQGSINGQNTNGEYRVTRYFVKRNGKWLVAASHTTYVEPVRLTLASKAKKPKREKKKIRNTYASELRK